MYNNDITTQNFKVLIFIFMLLYWELEFIIDRSKSKKQIEKCHWLNF